MTLSPGRCSICNQTARFLKHPEWVATGGLTHKKCFTRGMKRNKRGGWVR